MSTTAELMPPPPVVRSPARSGAAWGFIVAAAILIAAHLPLLFRHAEQLWLRPHYQFFPLALLGVVVLAAARLRGYGPLKQCSAGYALPLLAVAWFLLAVAELLNSSRLGAIAAMVAIVVVLFVFGGGRFIRAMLPAILLLCFAIQPPPFELDRQLILCCNRSPRAGPPPFSIFLAFFMLWPATWLRSAADAFSSKRLAAASIPYFHCWPVLCFSPSWSAVPPPIPSSCFWPRSAGC